MFSPCLSVLLVSEALFIYTVKFVNRQVQQSVKCSGNVIFFSLYGRSLQNNKMSNIPFLINRQSISQTLSVIDSFDCRHLFVSALFWADR